MNLSRVTCTLFLALAVSGCGPADDASQAAPASPAAAPVVAEPASVPAPAPATVATDARLWFVPAALSSCEPPAKVMVYWDAAAVAGLKNVDLKTLRPNGEEGQFARAGRVGSKETGPWMSAGRVIVLRNAETGAELARATVDSLPCETAAQP